MENPDIPQQMAGLAQAGVRPGAAGAMSMFGAPVYGWLADRLARRHQTWPVLCCGVLAVAAAALGLFWVFVPVFWAAIISVALWELLYISYPILIPPVLMDRAADAIRSEVMSPVRFLINLLEWGVGPAAPGLLSDSLAPSPPTSDI